VRDWTSAFRKVQAAIGHGNRFVLTSRRHTYEAAKRSLGQRNHPAFLDGRAVVDVGELSSEEKTQILYNHITYGVQTQSWKRSVLPLVWKTTSLVVARSHLITGCRSVSWRLCTLIEDAHETGIGEQPATPPPRAPVCCMGGCDEAASRKVELKQSRDYCVTVA
jgi:hypothetical protein